MIFIDLFGSPPSPELIAEGEKLTRELMALAPDQRNAFIDKHDDYWGKLKEHYMDLSHGKCWYTEAKESALSAGARANQPLPQPPTEAAKS